MCKLNFVFTRTKKLFTYAFIFPIVFVMVFGVGGLVIPKTAEAACRNFISGEIRPGQSASDCPIGFSFVEDDSWAAGNNPLYKAAQAISPSSILNVATDILLAPLGWLAILILQIVNLLAWLAGSILNFVVQYTVVDMRENLLEITTLNTAWGAVRDLANMGFIFILLYAAIMTILGLGKDNQKLIVKVVVIAIVINFSLFFTRMIIDTSNILAIFFYEAIAPLSLQESATTGLAGQLVNPLGITSIFDVQEGSSTGVTVGGGLLSGKNLIIIGIMGSIVSLIVSFVLFAVSIMFIIRFVVLIFVMILSPIAFMAMILPNLSKYASQWRDALIGQAFFAPIYFMLTWVVVTIGNSGFISAQNGTMAQVFLGMSDGSGGVVPPGPGSIATIVNFIVMISFIIISLIISKEWSSKAGPGVNMATKWLSGATLGATAFVGRQTAGRLAENFKDSERYKQLEKASPTSMRARLQLAAVDKTRSGSFDARGGLVGKSMSAVGVPYDSTIQRQGGFEADRKLYQEFRETPGTEAYKKRQERGRKAGAELDIEAGATAAPGTPAYIAMEKALSKMSDKEVEAIVESNRKLLESQTFANSLSVKQLEAINKSDKFSETEKDVLKFGVGGTGGRFGKINTAIAGGPAAIAAAKDDIKALADAELEMIDPAHLSNENFVAELKQNQIDAIQKSNKFTARQKTEFKGARERPLKNAFSTSSWPTAATIMQKMGEQSLAKMSAGYDPAVPTTHTEPHLNNPEILNLYTPSILNKMAAQSDLNPTKRTAVRDAIMSTVHGNPNMSAALTALIPAAGRLRVTPAERQAALLGLSPEEKRLVTSAEWLESENGQQIF